MSVCSREAKWGNVLFFPDQVGPLPFLPPRVCILTGDSARHSCECVYACVHTHSHTCVYIEPLTSGEFSVFTACVCSCVSRSENPSSHPRV